MEVRPAAITLAERHDHPSRGVALWASALPLAQSNSNSPTSTCTRRVFFGTLDARLIALDANTGLPCSGFGANGVVDLKQDIRFRRGDLFSITSAPTIVGNAVIVGSFIGDNQRIDVESGAVRAFDAVSGKQLWSWEPLPWAATQHPRTGAGNAWSTISADPALGLVYVPTGSASPDFYGGLRPGDNRDADSVVALDARTGRKVWSFQTVHHNLWDYDLASQPLLFTFRDNIPAVVIATKSAQVFVLDRRTGAPLYPVEERRAPASDVAGETASATQPFSSLPALAPLTPPTINQTSWQRSEANSAFCQAQLTGLRYEGMYTPPSLRGTLLYPGSLGGVNWGSLALDPATATLFAVNNRVPFAIQLIDRRTPSVRWHRQIEPVLRDWPIWIALSLLTLVAFAVYRRSANPSLRGITIAMAVAAIAAPMCLFPMRIQHFTFGSELSPQDGSPYLLKRTQIVDHNGAPCSAPPWSSITALNLNTGKLGWQQTLGTNAAGDPTGSVTLGGPIATAGGLIFAAATQDANMRAFDILSGKELWRAALPAPGQATPMTYTIDGRQFVVIAAGGHGGFDEQRSDSLVAFALDASTEPKP